MESVLHAVEHALTAIERPQIGRNGEWCGTGRRNRFTRRGEIFSGRRDNDGLRASPREIDRDLPADATAAPGDDRYLIGKLP
jgi:hypothetical protein